MLFLNMFGIFWEFVYVWLYFLVIGSCYFDVVFVDCCFFFVDVGCVWRVFYVGMCFVVVGVGEFEC